MFIKIDFAGKNAQAEASALLQIIAMAESVSAKVTFDSTPKGVAPVAEKPKKALGKAEETRLEITTVGRSKSLFALGYGAGRAGAKLLLKSFGLKWDGEKRGYTGTKAQVEKFRAVLVEDGGKVFLPVSAEWVERGREQAQAKAERKARKSA